MTRALFVLYGPAQREKAARLLKTAPEGTRVEFKKARRTLDQNSLLWARLTEIAKKVVWYGQRLTTEDWKDVFTASLRKARVVPGLDYGSYVPLGMRTSDISKGEMSLLLDLIDAFAAQHGVVFQEPQSPEHASSHAAPLASGRTEATCGRLAPPAGLSSQLRSRSLEAPMAEPDPVKSSSSGSGEANELETRK